MMDSTLNIDYPQIYQDKYAFYIQREEGGSYYRQRRYVEKATDNPMNGTEQIIISLCEKILGIN